MEGFTCKCLFFYDDKRKQNIHVKPDLGVGCES